MSFAESSGVCLVGIQAATGCSRTTIAKIARRGAESAHAGRLIAAASPRWRLSILAIPLFRGRLHPAPEGDFSVSATCYAPGSASVCPMDVGAARAAVLVEFETRARSHVPPLFFCSRTGLQINSSTIFLADDRCAHGIAEKLCLTCCRKFGCQIRM